jgi:hypothetical protein
LVDLVFVSNRFGRFNGCAFTGTAFIVAGQRNSGYYANANQEDNPDAYQEPLGNPQGHLSSLQVCATRSTA